MMFSATFIALILPLSIAAAPSGPSLERSTKPRENAALAERSCLASTTGQVTYRTCSQLTCTAVGEYPPNTEITIECYVYGTAVEGDA